MSVADNSLEQKVVRSSPALWVLAFILALFLCGLGTSVLSDLADVIHPPDHDAFLTNARPLQAQLDALQSAPNPRTAQVQRADRDLQEQNRILDSAEASWRTWLETRATLGKSTPDDAEVRKRRNQLDRWRQERDAAEKTLADLKAQPDPRESQIADLTARLKTLTDQDEREFELALAQWRWKVLGARMGVIVPVWALAVWLWSRRQNSRYITMLWGYWGFAMWMLLYGVVPYLPQYGGYVPYTLGIVTTVWVSMGLVKSFNQKADQRRRRIVDRALARHQCPGCERDYLIGCESGLDAGVVRKATITHYAAEALHPRNCPACGLALFGPCRACGHVQDVHQDYCAGCSTRWEAAA